MKQKQQPKTRGETRRDLLEDFHKMLRAMVVIDQQAKEFIVQRYMSAITRLSEEIPRSAGRAMEWWDDRTHEDLWREYNTVEDEFDVKEISEKSNRTEENYFYYVFKDSEGKTKKFFKQYLEPYRGPFKFFEKKNSA